jgi:hypothetical protein
MGKKRGNALLSFALEGNSCLYAVMSETDVVETERGEWGHDTL